MSLFLQIKPVGWLTEGGREEKGGRVRNGVRSIKKVRFLGQREGATTTCSFLQAALAVSLSAMSITFSRPRSPALPDSWNHIRLLH